MLLYVRLMTNFHYVTFVPYDSEYGINSTLSACINTLQHGLAQKMVSSTAAEQTNVMHTESHTDVELT